MIKDYVIWENEEVPHAMVLDELKGADDLDVELTVGDPCLKSWPKKVVFTADPEFKRDIKLADSFDNTSNVVIASQKLKDFIESFHPPKVEFLPVTVLNHKSKPAGQYFLIHPIGPVDAFNPKTSGARIAIGMEDEKEAWFGRVDKMVLNKNKLDPDRLIFKLKSFYYAVLVRRDLAEAITKAGFTGIQWTECEKYKHR